MSTRFQLLILLDDVTYRETKINDEQLGNFLNQRTVSISRDMQLFEQPTLSKCTRPYKNSMEAAKRCVTKTQAER